MIMSTTNGNTAEKTIYLGAFAHCTSLQEVEICEAGAIGVDSNGKIAFVERDIGDIPAYQLRERKEGWEKAKVVQTQDQGFFFPGFIGKLQFIPDVVSQTDVIYQILTSMPHNIQTLASSENQHYWIGSTHTRSLSNHHSQTWKRLVGFTLVS
jgi:hypothetical protein